MLRRQFSLNPCLPAHSPELAKQRCVQLAVGGSYLKGTVLGAVTTAERSEIRTLTITGTPTGFTGTVTFTHGGGTTVATLANAVSTVPTAAEMQAVFDTIFGEGNTLVTKSSLVYTITFQNTLANKRIYPGASGDGLTASFTFTAGTGPAAAFTVSQKGSAGMGQYDTYNDANSDGTQTAKCILVHDFYSDPVGGRVTEQGAALQPESPEAYFSGYFRVSALTGLDAAAVTDLGKFSEGTSVSDTDAIIKF